MKQLVLPLLVAVSAAFFLQIAPAEAGRWPDSCGNNKTHNFNFGMMNYGDRILNSSHIVRNKEFMRVISYDYNIPTRGRISYIQVLDQNHDGNGGCVYLNGGGVGYSNVILHIKSCRNCGVNFIVNVYGR